MEVDDLTVAGRLKHFKRSPDLQHINLVQDPYDDSQFKMRHLLTGEVAQLPRLKEEDTWHKLWEDHEGRAYFVLNGAAVFAGDCLDY